MFDVKDKLAIRIATEADAEALSHIGVATFIDSYTADLDGAAMVAHCTRQHSRSVYETYLADPASTCWLAEYTPTGAPIGYAVNCPPDLPIDPQPGDLELKRIYAMSRFHGSGIGRTLMIAAIEQAKSVGAPRLLLGTYEENFRAIAFYTKHGFETIGKRAFDVGGKIYDDIVMAKTLS
ncbi:MAG: GNAT family N-acetyltransferase [Pseudomonadota bacterium]